MGDNDNSTHTGDERKKTLPVPGLGIAAVGAYLVVVTVTTVVVIWRVMPSCDVSGLIATRLEPSQALASGGEPLHVFGEGFERGVVVRIADLPPVQASVVSPFEIVVTTPKHMTGRVPVTVAHGTMPAVDVPRGLEYVDKRSTEPTPASAPSQVLATGSQQVQTPAGLQVSGVEPITAVVSGGDAITITGNGFTADTLVRFGGLPARSVRVDSSRFITAVTPMHAEGVVSVLVANDQSISSLDGRLRFVCPAPRDSVMVLLVLLAGALGGLVHALRSFFWYVGEQKLRWNWVPMYVLLPFASSALGFVFFLVIRAGIYEPTKGTSYLLVGLAALVGMFSAQATEKLKKLAEGLFTDVRPGSDAAPPNGASRSNAVTISAITPKSGPPAGGNSVTITGTGFESGSQVRFGSTKAPQVARVNDTTLEVVAPKGASGSVDVGVTVPGKAEVVKTGGYTYTTAKGTISKVDPPNGRVAGGATVTLTGTNFSNGVSVMFRDQQATVVSADPTTIVVMTPPQKDTGRVDVRVDKGSELIGIASGGFTYTP